MEAAGVAVALQSTPVVEAPGLVVGRARKDAPNKYGCVVGLEESREETTRVDAAKAKAATDKENKVETFWAKWRGAAQEAEAALKDAGGSPGAMKEQKGAYVARLKALYVSRAQKAPPVAWNNKPEADGEEGKLLKEVRKALAEHDESAVPPTPMRLLLDEASEEEQEGGEEGGAEGGESVGLCVSCGRELAEEGESEESPDDFYWGRDGHCWCACGAHVESR